MKYTLKNKDLTVIFESFGATLHSIKDNDGVEYLWQGNPDFWSGQAPVLFPICGSLRNDEAEIGDGKKTTMPFQIGGHPGFCCPLYADENYEDYELVFEKDENCTVPTPVTETGLINMEHRREFLNNTDRLQLKHDLFSIDAVILDQLKSRAVTLKSKKHNKRIRLDFEEFPYLILWSTAKEADFVALVSCEPVKKAMVFYHFELIIYGSVSIYMGTYVVYKSRWFQSEGCMLYCVDYKYGF